MRAEKLIILNSLLKEKLVEVVPFPIENVLDLGIDWISEEEIYFHGGNTILHVIARRLNRPSEGCCKEKWLSFLMKIVDRIPVDMMSTRNSAGYTPYDLLINNSSLFHDKKLMKKVLDILKPR